MKKIPVILDGDPGHDDAIAWTIANTFNELDILCVTAVAGNQTIQKTSYNARRVCTLIGLNVPVSGGCEKPLVNEVMNAPSVHGESGLDGPALPEPAMELYPGNACDLWAELISKADDKVTIVTTGPLTDAAQFIISYPELLCKIERISMMGGGIALGNWTPAAEFNILVDPEAADIVFNSGVPIVMAGLDVTEKALIMPEDFERIKALGNPVSDIVWQWLEFFYKFHKSIGYEGAPMHDPCAVMYLVHPEIFETKDMHVDIETCGEYTRGTTVGDIYGVTGKEKNATCIMNVDRDAFADYLVDAMKFYGGEGK